MIISHKYKFVFIHAPKTAGTSIRQLLAKNSCLNNDIVAGHWHNITEKQYEEFPHISRDIWTHTSAMLGKEFFEDNGWDWDSYFKFGFIRNPWDRMVSSYRYLIQDMKNHPNPHPKNVEIHERFHGKPIKDFIMERAKDPTRHYLCDKKGNLMVDYVGKFENLWTDMKEIIKQINPKINECEWSLPHRNSTSTKETKHYSHYYDNESKEMVRSKCGQSIELGNYKFEVEKKYLNDEDADLAIASLDFFQANFDAKKYPYMHKDKTNYNIDDIKDLRKKIYENSFFW